MANKLQIFFHNYSRNKLNQSPLLADRARVQRESIMSDDSNKC